MNLQGIILSETRQKEKDKYRMILLICGTVKKQSKQNKNSERACQWLSEGKRFGEVDKKGEGVELCGDEWQIDFWR